MTLGTILNTLITLVGGIAHSLGFGWKLALVMTFTIPALLLCGFLRFWVLAGFNARTKAAYKEFAVNACESVAAIRLTASLARESDVLSEYRDSLAAQRRRNLRLMMMSSVLYALFQSDFFGHSPWVLVWRHSYRFSRVHRALVLYLLWCYHIRCSVCGHYIVFCTYVTYILLTPHLCFEVITCKLTNWYDQRIWGKPVRPAAAHDNFLTVNLPSTHS